MIIETINKFLKFLWKLTLLITIEELQEKPESPLSILKIADCLLRLSSIAVTDQQELEFIKEGISLLKTVDYLKLDSETHSEELKHLCNAFEVYTEKWEAAIKIEKENLLTIIKKQNIGIYGILKRYLRTKKSLLILKYYTKNLTKNHNSDSIFIKLLSDIKKLVSSNDKDFNISIHKSSLIRQNFRKVLNKIGVITGIPRASVLTHKGSEWSLKKLRLFEEVNDEANENYNNLNISFAQINTKAKETKNKHYEIVTTFIKSYRSNHPIQLLFNDTHHSAPLNSNILIHCRW